jgi:hypothetical protein
VEREKKRQTEKCSLSVLPITSLSCCIQPIAILPSADARKRERDRKREREIERERERER